MLGLALLTCLFSYRIRRLPIGRAWEALREDETACRALGINPEYADAHLYRGHTLLALGRPADAVCALSAAAEVHSKSASILGSLAVALARSGQIIRASQAAREALGLDPECAAARDALGLVALVNGQVEEARSLLRGSEPVDEGALSLAAGQPQDAIKEIERAERDHGNSVEADILLGMAREAMGQDEAARTHFERALVKDAAWWPARLALARNLSRRGQYKEALAAIGRELEAETDNPDVLLVAGECHRQLERPQVALAVYNRALALSAACVPALIGRALCHRMLGRDSAAIMDLHEVMRRDPLNLVARRLFEVEPARETAKRRPVHKAVAAPALEKAA